MEKNMKKDILKTGYKMSSALDVIIALHQTDKLMTVMEGMGFNSERRVAILNFLNESVQEEEYNANIELQAFTSYIEGLQEMERYMQMASGYQEMGDINLTITQEDFHLEEEGANAYEMVTKDTKGDIQAG